MGITSHWVKKVGDDDPVWERISLISHGNEWEQALLERRKNGTHTFPHGNRRGDDPGLPEEESPMIMGSSVSHFLHTQQEKRPWPMGTGNGNCLELDDEMGNSSLGHVPARE